MAPSADEVRRGAAVYSRALLTWYDLFVLGLACRFVWRAPRPLTQAVYDRHVSANHVELGPGTGYFLRRSSRADNLNRLALVDLNDQVLTYASRRLAAFRPETYQRDVLRPLDLDGAQFGSAGLNFLLHCIPGTIAEKAVVFDQLADVVEPGGRIFGSTVLGPTARHSFAARRLLTRLNKAGVMHNRNDTLDDLTDALAARFTNYRVTLHGSVAYFEATRP
ncbi:class I SAM-dependent methyltransferase [Kribbella sp. NBC_01245]|uniref:class I SAM-dependent methyltransferase n=1 Tax=Kribbella sp. NBC_01245 TaxID=2903578 RepID=UPI002E2ABE5F|nr:class I SAM-dependent methyltransferase [Kribbella sp. NBC_01245]